MKVCRFTIWPNLTNVPMPRHARMNLGGNLRDLSSSLCATEDRNSTKTAKCFFHFVMDSTSEPNGKSTKEIKETTLYIWISLYPPYFELRRRYTFYVFVLRTRGRTSHNTHTYTHVWESISISPAEFWESTMLHHRQTVRSQRFNIVTEMGHLFSRDWPVSAGREKFFGGFDHVDLIFLPLFYIYCLFYRRG